MNPLALKPPLIAVCFGRWNRCSTLSTTMGRGSTDETDFFFEWLPGSALKGWQGAIFLVPLIGGR